MSKTLEQIAEQLRDVNKKVQLIYAFNGTGKTRLSLELKKKICLNFDAIESVEDIEDFDPVDNTRSKFLYYNAFTEDLFHWDNDLEHDLEPQLEIKPNFFTDWVLKNQGLDRDIIDIFQKFTGSKTEPLFNIEENTVTFSNPKSFPLDFPIEFGARSDNFKISKGEESNFIWSVFYALLKQAISIRDDQTDDNSDYDQLEYVFIDDPVSSLDDQHLIDLAVDLANTIKTSRYEGNQGLRFVITTHNPLFYNVLHNELNNDLYEEKPDGSRERCIYKRGQSKKYTLKKHADGTFKLEDSNDRPFSYHLFLLDELRKIDDPQYVEKYHFNFLRNILEKTASFLGYSKWSDLLPGDQPDDKKAYYNRIIQFTSHSTLSNEEVRDPTGPEKQIVNQLLKNLIDNYGYLPNKEDENAATN